MNRSEALTTVRAIAVPQRGLFSRNQARLAGINDMWLARMKDVEVEQVQHGVWCISDTQDDPHRAARVAVLLLDPDGTSFSASAHQPRCVVSHLTAAVMHGMCEQMPAQMKRPVVTTSSKITTTRRVNPVHAQLAPSEIVWIDGVPATSAERTLSDLRTTGFADIGLDTGAMAGADDQINRRTGT